MTIIRFILRVLPVEVSCYASEEEIGRAIKPVIEQHFPAETQTPHKVLYVLICQYNTVTIMQELRKVVFVEV